MSFDVSAWVLATSAAFLLSRLWAVESVFSGARNALVKDLLLRRQLKLAELAQCARCLSFWLSGLIMLVLLATSVIALEDFFVTAVAVVAATNWMNATAG